MRTNPRHRPEKDEVRMRSVLTSSMSRRGLLVFSCRAAGMTLLPFPVFMAGSGCTNDGDLYELRLPSGRMVRSGEFIALGIAEEGETPAQLFERLATDEDGDHTDIWALRGLVTWRVVTDTGTVLVTVGSDALPTAYQFTGGTVVEYRLVELEDSARPEHGETFEQLNAERPPGTETVVLRDHIIVTDTDGYVAREGDFVVYVSPDSEEY